MNRSNRMVWARALCVPLLLAGVVAPVAAQYPRIGIIDFYGLRSVRPADLAAAIGLQIGDSMVEPTAAIRQRLLGLPRVQDAAVDPVCCDAGRTILYIGVRETGAPILEFAKAPSGSVRLPSEIVAAGRAMWSALLEGVQRGQNGQSDSAGYAVFLYPPARAIQKKLIRYGATHTDTLREVLHNSSEAEHRALAAQMLAYGPDKRAVINDLVTAMRDPDGGVRNDAMRALAVMAVYAQAHPAAELLVPYGPFVDMLSSLEWTDRNKAMYALTALTATRDAQLLNQLRQRALHPLAEMARWHALGHAAPAGIILGRIAGIPEDQIFPMFQKNRDGLIAAALAN